MSIEHLIWKANPAQSHTELEWLLLAVERYELRPKVVLEIGVHRGGSARVWRAAWDPELLIGVDDDHVVEHPEEIGIEMVYGRSQEVLAAVLDALDGRRVDFLFIDGGHKYDEVRSDWMNYMPLCREGAIVALHDVYAESGVRRLLQELDDGTGGIELFHHPADGGTGTAVIWL